MTPLDVVVLYNEPLLPADHPDATAEAGVLESVEAVTAALAKRGHRARGVALGASVAGVLDKLTRLAPCDVVFNLFEGFGGVGRGEAPIAGLVELLGYPITGSPPDCLALVRDKARTKWLLAGAGLPTAEFLLVPTDESLEASPITERFASLLAGGPVIVKPAHEDASQGIDAASIVTELTPLVDRVRHIRERYGAVLVERFIVGREFNAAIVDFGSPQLLPLAEIEFSGGGPRGWQIVTYEAKWSAGSAADLATPPRCPACVDAASGDRIGRVALDAYRLAGGRGYARVDLRLDDQGRAYVLEINGNPDIGPSAGFARALRAANLAYEDFVAGLVESAYADVHNQRGN